MNIYITQLVFGGVEVPGSLLSFTLNQRIGRRLTQLGSLFLAGAASLSILAIPRGTLVALARAFNLPSDILSRLVLTSARRKRPFALLLRLLGCIGCQP